ncbi:DNA-binding transcriptional LysR family regulator [Agrobacterium tumefaciens]|nr:DNA-binding transcriptional LysR family regulator [Agrobacterium tumefaciens]
MRTEFVAPAGSRTAFRLPTLSRLPPLTALRAFVVAARHASFSRAAEELHVSTAAIGQQVRILETHLGQPLFSRQRGELLLTDAGSALYPGLADAFETMTAAFPT